MTLARATITGTVYRTPEKRFTSNNIPIVTFTINVSEKEETLLKVIARGNVSELLVNSVNKDDKIVVEGRLQTSTVKSENGQDKKVMEIDLSSFEKLSGGSSSLPKEDKIVEFSTEEFTDDLIGDDEIPF